jgi:hypothetical protein
MILVLGAIEKLGVVLLELTAVNGPPRTELSHTYVWPRPELLPERERFMLVPGQIDVADAVAVPAVGGSVQGPVV